MSKTESFASQHRVDKQESMTVIYHSHFERLLKYPKGLRDQLVFELPILQGLRSGEVSNQRFEWVDLDNGDLYVLDSKKFKLMPIPLHPQVAQHIFEYTEAENIHDGYLIRAMSHAHRKRREHPSRSRGLGMSVSHINYIWNQYCKKIGIPSMGARMGRAYFATKWLFIDHKNIYHLMNMLRHDSIQSTEHYVSKFVDYRSLKNEFYLGQFPINAECSRFQSCQMSTRNCHCKLYMVPETVTLKQ